MFLARISPLIRSLRFRLMLWNALVVIVTGAVLLLSVREGVRRALVSELETTLKQNIAEALTELGRQPMGRWQAVRDELEAKARSHTQQQWFVQQYDRDGRVVWETTTVPEPFKNGLKSTTNAGFRVVSKPLPESAGERGTLVIGASQASVDRDVARIDRQVAIASAIVLLFAPIGGYLLAVRATEPVSRMIEVSDSLRPEELEERFETRGTGDELDRLAITINSLLDRINDYIKKEQESLANAAHQLRTPLAALRSTLEVALDDSNEVEDRGELLADVIQECDSLETLVNQLLLLAETDIDRHGRSFEPVRFDHLVTKTAELFQAVAEDRNIVLNWQVASSITVKGNQHHLRQLLYNLVDNAIKFTADRYKETQQPDDADSQPSDAADNSNPAGRIDITLACDATKQVAVLTVQDNGPGIAPEHVGRLFSRFYRAQPARNRNSAPSGSGLGLSICQAIVRSHGGTIEVQSAPLVGATFVVSLPLTTTTDRPASDKPSS